MNTDKRIEHTPTPWLLDERGEARGNNGVKVRMYCIPVSFTLTKEEEAAANVDFMFKACNHFYEMREALKRISEENYDDDDKSRHLRATIDRMKSTAESILKKTE